LLAQREDIATSSWNLLGQIPSSQLSQNNPDIFRAGIEVQGGFCDWQEIGNLQAALQRASDLRLKYLLDRRKTELWPVGERGH
jgi:hypothetical protein